KPVANGKTKSPTLYRGWDEPGSYVWSYIVTKVEARFRFANLRYRVEAGSRRKAPRGKIPYLELGSGLTVNPTILSDSSIIIAKLVESGQLPDLNASLSPVDRAHDLALRSLLEEKWYFYQACEKWNENYIAMRDHILWHLPHFLQVILGFFIYRQISATLRSQGSGRFSSDELASFSFDIWQSVNALLVESQNGQQKSDQPFWVLRGEGPSEADAALYGAIAAALVSTACPKAKALVESFPTIMDYATRIHNRYFPDYEMWE
ncbi:hypothetical protein HYALB_00011173, partial [Hymenoscyphus albidus]